MSLIYDDSRFSAEVRGMVLRCRIQIVRTGTSDVVLVTQSWSEDDGPSVEFVAEELGDILGALLLGGRPGRLPFVRHIIGGAESKPACRDWPDRGGLFKRVSFKADGEAQFEDIAPDIEAAIRKYANPGRGEVERPSPGEAPMRALRAVPSGMMPEPHNLFRAECMTGKARHPQRGGLRVRNWLRAVGWKRGGLPVCNCWYRSVDWKRASGAAIEAVRESFQPGREGDTMDALRGRARAVVLGCDLSGVDLEGALSLLGDPIVVDGDLEGFVNGQHRSTAMKDQGVSEVLVESSISPSSEPPNWTICALV